MKYLIGLFCIAVFVSCKNDHNQSKENELIIKAQLRQLDYKIEMLKEQSSSGAFWFDTLMLYNSVERELKLALTTNTSFPDKRKKFLSFSLNMLRKGFLLDDNDKTFETNGEFSIRQRRANRLV